MKRVILIVKGRVQRVGYRDFVEEIARKLGIAGFVENLKPYDVKIVCEGEEGKIKQFLEEIKHPPKPAEVEDIKVNFEEPKKEFEYFEIKRGESMEELGERMDVAGKVLYDVRDMQKETINSVNGMKIEVKGMRTDLTQSVNGMKTEVIDRFGSIGGNMEKILFEFQNDRKEQREFMEKMIKSIEDLTKSVIEKK